MSHTIPGGQSKGTPIEEAQDRDLEYWISAKQKRMAEDPNHRYAASDQEWIEAAQTELERRGMEGGTPPSNHNNVAPAPAVAATPKPAPPPTASRAATQNSKALATVDMSAIIRGSDVSKKLEELQAICHLVSPATASADLPEGFSLAISMVQINPRGGTQEVFPVPGGKGLARASLERISGAAGVTWDPQLCRRLDDGRHPHYCSWTVVGYVRNLDGSVRTITGSKEMDLREGSAQVEALIERSKDKKADGTDRKDPTGQIREMRLHIAAHAETKAKLRAIRSLGIQASYTDAELAKPFAVVRLAATGRTEDPILHREFARMNYAAAVNGSAQLYGGALPPAPVAAPSHQLQAPGAPRREIEYDDQTGEVY